MNKKDKFLNIINDINNIAVEHGYNNAKAWVDDAYNKGFLSFNEKGELIRFIQMRNIVSHGGAGRINIFEEDMIKLKHYKKLMNKMFGIVEESINIKKENKTSINKNTNNEIIPDSFNNDLKPRTTGKPSDIIRNLFIQNRGTIHIKTLTGIEYDIYLNYDGESFKTIALPIYSRFDFNIFDIVYDLLKRENGKAKKGNGHNYRLGEQGCSEKTVCGIIGYEYFKKNTGDSVFDPVFIICAMMEYAGICKNTRGFLILK